VSDAVPPSSSALSRRSFLKGIGTSALTVATVQAGALADEINKVSGPQPQGPGAVPVTLTINGEARQFNLEPRVTLLDALRYSSPLTGTKEVCDRGTCGACSVLIDGKLTYACMKLAIDAQGQKITTVEGLAPAGQLSPVQQAFVECDGLMCGFCTPGLVMAVTSLLSENPHPTEADVRHACSGNLCRCGTYPHVLRAALKASGAEAPPQFTVTDYGSVA
jgi:xanthine dehydrogenase YagT iron-sulfur-binding subunit